MPQHHEPEIANFICRSKSHIEHACHDQSTQVHAECGRGQKALTIDALPNISLTLISLTINTFTVFTDSANFKYVWKQVRILQTKAKVLASSWNPEKVICEIAMPFGVGHLRGQLHSTS